MDILAKNARINSEERLSAMLAELVSLSWSVVCFTETRRISADDIISGGHRLISYHPNLSEAPASGVAILIHDKFKACVEKKHLISHRVMAIDMLIGHQ